MSAKKSNTSKKLVEAIIGSIQEKKGENITKIDLRKLHNADTDYFIICEGNSDTQVGAIADEVERGVRKKIKEKPWHIEGKENLEWVLIDYFNVVVHIFKKQTKAFYGLEDLWADGIIENIE